MSEQVVIPGTLEIVDAIEVAAEAYVKARNARMALTKEEVESRTALIGAMNGAERTAYKTASGLFVMLTSVDKVKVKAERESEPEDPDAL